MGKQDKKEAEQMIGSAQARIVPQWQQFAETGGYTPEGLAAIRSRSYSPIRSVYSGAKRELSRQRALQGGYSPGYSTALGRFAREQGQLTSDAATNAEALIAELLQKGKLAGLTGLSGFDADLIKSKIAQGQMSGFNWGGLMRGLGTAAGYAGMMISSRELKEDIKEIDSKDIVNKFKKLRIYEWKYKGDDEKHIGPMAEDFKRVFGKGDGKTISVIDAIGASLAMNKALAEKV